MPSEPTKYKTARIMADMTQFDAADKLYISVSNLKRIESGQQVCSMDIAIRMDVIYGTTFVSDPATPIHYKPLPRAQAALKYLNEREDVETLMPRARRILADGKVDKNEAEEFQQIINEVQEERDAGRDLIHAI